MHLIEIPGADIKRYFPEDLSECNQVQYINMCALLLRYQMDKLTLDEFLKHGLIYLLNIEVPKETLSQAVEDQIYSNISQMSKMLISFFEEIKNEDKIVLQIKQYYTHNPMPSFRSALYNYYGPSDDFDTMTFGEYVDALDPYEDFHQIGEIKYLYNLLAIFYRRKKTMHVIRRHFNNYNGDIRKSYNQNKVEKLAKKFKRQPIGIVYGFYLLFASFQKYITTVKIYIQGREIDFSILFDETLTKKLKESDIPGIGMRSFMYTMAESNIFGDLEKVRNTPFWEIYIRMYDIRKRDLDQQANEPKK